MKSRKFHLLTALGLSLLTVVLVSAQNGVETKLATGFNAIKEKNLRADLTFLASDALEGRMSLQRGSEIAISFMAAEFAKAGLKALVEDWCLQSVDMIEYVGQQSEISVHEHAAGAGYMYEA